ncbi:MAG TPA: NAD(P)H-dependent oxidoreductase [Terriglobales bacterium]|jgi:FMN-dependent NADH-azoreductase
MKLLHIDASIRGSHSVSRELTAAIVDKLTKERPRIEVTYRDLAAWPPPHMTLASLPWDHPSARFAGSLDPAAQRVRNESQRILDEFMAADVVVLGAPMYNWGVPTQLKAWFDIIIVPGKTFAYGEQGPIKGLAGDKRFIVALSRGAFYGRESDWVSAEHAESYLRTVLSFLGVRDPQFILAEGTMAGEQNKTRAMMSAMNGVRALETRLEAAF